MVGNFERLGVVIGRSPHKPKIHMKFPAALLYTDSRTLGGLLLNTGLGMEVDKPEGVLFKDTRETPKHYPVGCPAGVHRDSRDVGSKLPTQVDGLWELFCIWRVPGGEGCVCLRTPWKLKHDEGRWGYYQR